MTRWAGTSDSLYLSIEEWPRLPSTARIGRAPFHRARSASKEGTWPLLLHPSKLACFLFTGWPGRSSNARVQRGPSATARCASTEDHQPSSRPLSGSEAQRHPCSFPHLRRKAGTNLDRLQPRTGLALRLDRPRAPRHTLLRCVPLPLDSPTKPSADNTENRHNSNRSL